MKIHKYEIPNDLILNYCRIIKMGEKGYNCAIMAARSEVHNEIFNHAKCCRSLYRRDDRLFSIALDKVVLELTSGDY